MEGGGEHPFMNIDNRLKIITDKPNLSDEYIGYVDYFLGKAFAREKSVLCPCKKCLNRKRTSALDDIRLHLLRDGFDRNYDVWTFHGEIRAWGGGGKDGEGKGDNKIDEMFDNVMMDFDGQPEVLASFLGEKRRMLYPDCKANDTVISCLMEIFNMKGASGWSDVSVNKLLKFLHSILPKGNGIPDNLYEAKKILCPMGLEYEKIHACPNDCVLFRGKGLEELDECPVCNASRYKKIVKKKGIPIDDVELVNKKRIPVKCLWYLPIVPRLKRLFANVDDAKNMTWYADKEASGDDVISHTADGDEWKNFDKKYPKFASETRNVRFALCTDGMNPFGNMSSKHSSWPVMLAIYNLPPYLCMKRKYVLMPLMISGPKQPGNDIDVYLAPLVEELEKLWKHGVLVKDAHRGDTFNLKGMLHCTVSDLPALSNLSGYVCKGHKACPICEEKTDFEQLKHGRKTVFLGYRKFLRSNHKFRQDKGNFFGGTCVTKPPLPLSGRKIRLKVSKLQIVLGKKVRKSPELMKSPWKKRSIFFNLPYWEDLEVRHSLDVMHIEKNVCDSVIGTLLNIPSKTKDNLNSRKDMVDRGMRMELAPEVRGKKIYLPPSPCNLSKDEKKSVCDSLASMKLPIGYSSNIARIIGNDYKLSGLKSHDCHVLMQQLLPVALRGVLDEDVRYCLTRLCFFFHSICRKALDRVELDVLENEAVEIMCELEMYFPPSFFDIMLHLVVHVVREIRLLGPVFMHWMYPFERHMGVFKKYVKNKFRPDASIVERYVTEEIIEYCTTYLDDGLVVGKPIRRHEGKKLGVSRNKGEFKTPLYSEMMALHHYILRNSKETVSYVEEHLDILKELYGEGRDTEILTEHQRTFVEWFNSRCNREGMDPNLRAFARKPNCTVRSYSGYDINGYSYSTVAKDAKSTTQSSGVFVEGETMTRGSKKDKKATVGIIPFYGQITEIWEVDYVAFRVAVFKCKWVNYDGGVDLTDPMGFVRVRLDREGSQDDRFILASQAKQVFYVDDPVDSKWSIVLQGKKFFFEDEIDYQSTSDKAEFPSVFPNLNDASSNITYRRKHEDGLLCEEDGTLIEDDSTKKRKKRN